MPKITNISATNFKSLKVLDLSPTGCVVTILGSNEAGKSNCLKAVLALLDGRTDAGDTIHHGEPRAEVTATLDNGLTARKRWTPRGATVELTADTPEGKATMKSPQTALRSMLGPFVDVGRIFDLKGAEGEREFREALLQAANVSTSDLDDAIEQTFSHRSDVARDLKAAKARLEAIPTPRPGTPDEEISVAAKSAEIAAWERQIDERRQQERERATIGENVTRAAKAVARLRDELQEAETVAAEWQAKLDAHEIPDAPDPADVATARRDLTTLEEQNAAIRQASAWRDEQEAVAELTAKHDELSEALNSFRASKVDRLRSVPMPIEGLEITEDGVSYRGERYHNLNRANVIKLGVALGLATRGSLDAIFIDNGEALDARNEAEIVRMCQDADVTAFIARTSREHSRLVIEGADYKVDSGDDDDDTETPAELRAREQEEAPAHA